MINKLIKKNIIDESFNKLNLSIDYLSNTKQGEVSTNLFILLNSQLNKKNHDLRKNIHKNIINFEYVKKIEITKVGFINIFFEEDFLIKKLYLILSQPNNNVNNVSPLAIRRDVAAYQLSNNEYRLFDDKLIKTFLDGTADFRYLNARRKLDSWCR